MIDDDPEGLEAGEQAWLAIVADRNRLLSINADLLAALEIMVTWVEGQQRIGAIHKGLDFPSARAAIAKARP